MVSKLLNICGLTITGLANIKIWSDMVAIYINSLGISKIYHN